MRAVRGRARRSRHAVGDAGRTALERVVAVVVEAGGSVESTVKINGYLADLADLPVCDRIYKEIIKARLKPARTTVQVGAFAPPILVEVDAIALRTTSPTQS